MLSRLLVSNTIKGSFPHNSSTERLRYFPAKTPIDAQASSLPVKLTPWTAGCAIIISDCHDVIYNAVNTPCGNPASSKSAWIASRHIGTLDACLYICVFPAKIFGTAARRSWLNGKFHGAIP